MVLPGRLPQGLQSFDLKLSSVLLQFLTTLNPFLKTLYLRLGTKNWRCCRRQVKCVFYNCVLLVTLQFERLFFVKFYKNAEFCFTFFLSYVVSTQTLHCFGGEEHVSLSVSQAGWMMVHDGKHLSLMILKDSSWLPGETSWGHVDMWPPWHNMPSVGKLSSFLYPPPHVPST